MVRTCFVVNRQLMVAPAALRSDARALAAFPRLSSLPLRPRGQARGGALNSISAMLRLLPFLEVW